MNTHEVHLVIKHLLSTYNLPSTVLILKSQRQLSIFPHLEERQMCTQLIIKQQINSIIAGSNGPQELRAGIKSDQQFGGGSIQEISSDLGFEGCTGISRRRRNTCSRQRRKCVKMPWLGACTPSSPSLFITLQESWPSCGSIKKITNTELHGESQLGVLHKGLWEPKIGNV